MRRPTASLSGGVPGSLVGERCCRPQRILMSSSLSPLFSRGSWPEASRITAVLRCEELDTDHVGNVDLYEGEHRRTPVKDHRIGVPGAAGRGRGGER